MNSELYRMTTLVRIEGRSRAAIYEAIKVGTHPRPVRLGARTSVWPAYEIEALNLAIVRGANPAELTNLVEVQHQARAQAGLRTADGLL